MDIINSISYGEYQEGDFLPSENQLCKKYQVSRDTVRKSLRLLEEDGYIQKIMGKGSRVLPLPKQFDETATSGLLSFAELDATNATGYITKVISIEDEKIPEELIIKGDYPEEAATKLTRVRVIDQVPTILDIDYLVKDIVPVFEEKDVEKSLYLYLEDVLGLDISYGNKEITIGKANAQDSELLGISEGDSVAVIVNNVFLSDTRLLQVTVSKHREDTFKFSQFTRRKKIKE
ncbi:trehalose operon repressor [Enterococcus termitis]|nr:trehalose operon repressor [Enterococcus termitis]